MDVERMSRAVDALIDYAISQNLMVPADTIWARNTVLALIGCDGYARGSAAPDATTQQAPCEASRRASVDPELRQSPTDEAPQENPCESSRQAPPDPEPLLAEIADCARAAGLLDDGHDAADRLNCALMNVVMPRPSEVNAEFEAHLSSGDPQGACDYLYHVSQAAAYVHAAASLRDIKWRTPTTWGDLEITINLSKPEKDPRAIAALAAKKADASAKASAGASSAAGANPDSNAEAGRSTSGQSLKAPADLPTYPACQLCLDNEGYAGRLPGNDLGTHPARQNLRIVRIPLDQPLSPQDGDIACWSRDLRGVAAPSQAKSQPDGDSTLVEGQLEPCPETCAESPSGQAVSRQAAEMWALQYSPYAYYNEHCIVINPSHEPMHIDETTFRRLLNFVDLIPNYFIGSNADLPIVGGSILNHDHFQAGRHLFPMDAAPIDQRFAIPGFPQVHAGVVKWPLSVLRLTCTDREELIAAATHVLGVWRAYNDPDANVFAETDGERHNTITPIARHEGGAYTLNLALRCNITTPEHPLGLFHPHEHLHHIKKENIGLIEVMGLAILPARLSRELAAVEQMLISAGNNASNGDDNGSSSSESMSADALRATLEGDPQTAKHADWALDVLARHPELSRENVHNIIQDEVGHVFREVLECAGVFKWDAAGRAAQTRFLEAL